MSIGTDLKTLIAGLLPIGKPRVIVRGHQQSPAVGPSMDVDAVHAAFRLAESGDFSRLCAIYRDILAGHSHTQAEFNKRKLAVIGEPLTLTSKNPKDPVAVARDLAVQESLTERPGWVQWLSHNLDSTMYPIALTAKSYRISTRPGWRYEIGDLVPIPHTHIAWPYGELSIRETDDEGHFLGTFQVPSPRTHILHKGHLLSSVPDWWGGPMRALVFWWLFATCDRDWWVRFLDRFGSPFLEGKYNESDERARYELQDAFSAATRLFGIVVSKDTELKMHQANSVGAGEAFKTYHDTANEEISKLIVGQTSSSTIKNAGLGGGQGEAQAQVRDDIRKYDGFALSRTIATQLLGPLWRINGWTTPVPTVQFGAVSEEEASLTGDLVSSLYSAGIELSDSGMDRLSGKLGLGLRRVPSAAVALSARNSLPLLPAVARRAARQRQARGAVDSLVTSASPKLARLMQSRHAELSAAIDSADSPEAAAAAVASLAAAYDPGLAAELISSVLSSAACNAVIAMD